MINPLTSPNWYGVLTRYGGTAVGAVLSVMLWRGWVDQATADAVTNAVPGFLEAIGPVLAAGIPIYAALTKALSSKAKAAGDAVDKGIANGDITKSTPIEIKTPAGTPDLPVPATK